jgi:hypothetical protein
VDGHGKPGHGGRMTGQVSSQLFILIDIFLAQGPDAPAKRYC